MRHIVVFLLFIVSLCSHALEKPELVQAVLDQSSLKTSLNSIPSQLAQLPAALQALEAPEEAKKEQFLQFMAQFSQNIASQFNEAEAYDFITQYFIEHGDKQKLETTLEWLQSPVGRTITNNEIQMQLGGLAEMQAFMASFSPSTVPAERKVLFNELIEATDIAQMMAGTLKELMPTMMKSIGEMLGQDAEVIEQKTSTFMSGFDQQMASMQAAMGEQIKQQMFAAFAYQFKDISTDDLRLYKDYFVSDAGQHFLALTFESSADYSLTWLVELLPSIERSLEPVAAEQ
jgi:hypothetical protein